MLDEICSVFAFSEQVFQAAFLQFGDTAKKIWGVQRGSPPLWRWVSNRGASIPVGTRFSAGKSRVLYLCFRLTRERGRRTLQQGRVWRQTLWVGPSGMLGGEIPVELLWDFPQAKQPFVLLLNRKKQSFERKL